MVRALISHQCGPHSFPGLGIIYELSFLSVVVIASRAWSLCTLVFPLLKNAQGELTDLKVSNVVTFTTLGFRSPLVARYLR